MDKMFEELHDFLCPNITIKKIMDRCDVISKQMERDDPHFECYTSKVFTVSCGLCGNDNESFMVEDHAQGIMICLGADGQGCGNVVTDNLLQPQYTDHCEEFNPFEMFSAQADFNSTISSTLCGFQKLSKTVDMNLNRYGREDTVTGDHYKDKQRKEAYSLLDQISIHTTVPLELINKVKLMFHHFRNKMYRIHKLEMALLCLFYIVMHQH
jgi:hypothetical protein